jgi:hypothetical protein
VLVSWLMFLMFHNSLAQKRNRLIGRRISETGSIELALGPDYCFGDQFELPIKQSFLTGSNWNVSLGYRNACSTKFGYKATVEYGKYIGTDEATHVHGAGFYSFMANMINANIRGEYTYSFGKSFHRQSNLYALYSFLGIGILNSHITFAPNAYAGKGNETAPFLPVGGGFKYHLNESFTLGTELSYRYVLSDYVDGYKSPAAISRCNDVVIGMAFTIEYRL